MTFLEALSDTSNSRFAWFWCFIGIHWCTEWSNPDEDEERRYQSQRCTRCGKVWERRIPIR